VAGIVIALDRQECGAESKLSASQEITRHYGFPVLSIAGLTELLELAENDPALAQTRSALQTYRDRYGARYDTD
jgi:orotate phosphoribosyltransferase